MGCLVQIPVKSLALSYFILFCPVWLLSSQVYEAEKNGRIGGAEERETSWYVLTVEEKNLFLVKKKKNENSSLFPYHVLYDT